MRFDRAIYPLCLVPKPHTHKGTREVFLFGLRKRPWRGSNGQNATGQRVTVCCAFRKFFSKHAVSIASSRELQLCFELNHFATKILLHMF